MPSGTESSRASTVLAAASFPQMTWAIDWMPHPDTPDPGYRCGFSEVLIFGGAFSYSQVREARPVPGLTKQKPVARGTLLVT